MAYRAYQCKHCGRIDYAFEDEFERATADSLLWSFCLCNQGVEKLPPNPFVIHQTEMFMCEPMLDSMNSSIELDRILTREARQLREDKMVDMARRNA